MNTNDCKGCLIYENCMHCCTVRNAPNRLNCPCQDCEKESDEYKRL